MGVPSLLIFLAAVIASIWKLADRNDKEKKFSLFGLGEVGAGHLLAYCLSCPILVIAYLIIGSALGNFSIPYFINFALAAIIFTDLLFLAYIAIFLLYVFCLAFRSIFFRGKQSGLAMRQKAKRTKR